MAIGLTPKHVEVFTFNDLTQQQFLALAYQTVTKLNWKISYISDNGLIAYTDNGVFSWNAEVTIKVEAEFVTIQSASVGNEMIDFSKNKKNIAKFDVSFEELKLILSTEELDIKYQELKEQFVDKEDDILIKPPATGVDQILNIFSIFIPKKGFFITPILLNLNVLVFILMAISGVSIIMPDNESLILWGANFRPITLQGEWWRIITSCFLHIGIFHLLMNMYALLYIGVILEPYLGKLRFAMAYLLTGIIASMASLWWHDYTISAGASGAIFGMYGVFLAMLTTNLIEKTARKSLLISIAIFVGYNLMNGMKEGIDNAAHLGGLLSGLVIGYALLPSIKKPENNSLQYGTLGLLTLLMLTTSIVVYNKLPNDIAIYDTKIKTFIALETKAMEVYNLPTSMPDEKVLIEIKDNGINAWKEGLVILESFDQLDLPTEVKNRNLRLKEYCELRIKSYELIYKAIEEDTDQYAEQINKYNLQIEAIVKNIGGG